ncbi:zinc finger protein 546-like [Pollicipes pollicipes]|uniref:zinc finger protein 546-like n=1 Tax=Pollicipes pollicipes TaxID=41117 RepID=UPI0018857B95|nr:zinc finger protein 546-like [Pollicipes pollicipes]
MWRVRKSCRSRPDDDFDSADESASVELVVLPPPDPDPADEDWTPRREEATPDERQSEAPSAQGRNSGRRGEHASAPEEDQSEEQMPEGVTTTTIEFVSIDGPQRRRGRGAGLAKYGLPKVIEFSSVSTLREQVKHVKTPRCTLKLRRANLADMDKIQHLNVDNKSLSAATHIRRSHNCVRCGEVLHTLKEQIEHLHTAHKGKSWCRRCRTEFDSKQANAEHRPECKRVNAAGVCGRCGKHVKHLKTHMRTHDSPNKRKREPVIGPDGKMVSASLAGGVCNICKKFVSHRLKRHVDSHIQHPCPICKKLFSREDVIAGHIKRVHMKERPYVCNHCGKGFVSLYSMQRHEMIHTNSYRFYCQECGDGFRQKQQLTAHMRHKHGVLEIEFEDVTESTILEEMADDAVANELRFYCQECGAGFHSRRQLTGHMRRKHGVANVVFEDVQLHVTDHMVRGAATVTD